MDYRASQGVSEVFLGLGLSSRKNLCVHPVVSNEKLGTLVDAKCQSLTASWVRESTKNHRDASNSCVYYESLMGKEEQLDTLLPSGVYTLDELKQIGALKSLRPYFLARKLV
jgi:DNA excision repair protein ERCC-2